MKKFFAVVLLIATILCIGYSGDEKATIENGKDIIDLPPGEKFVNFSSSYYHDYVIHRKRRSDEPLEEYVVDRVDNSGGIHSTYIVREH